MTPHPGGHPGETQPAREPHSQFATDKAHSKPVAATRRVSSRRVIRPAGFNVPPRLRAEWPACGHRQSPRALCGLQSPRWPRLPNQGQIPSSPDSPDGRSAVCVPTPLPKKIPLVVTVISSCNFLFLPVSCSAILHAAPCLIEGHPCAPAPTRLRASLSLLKAPSWLSQQRCSAYPCSGFLHPTRLADSQGCLLFLTVVPLRPPPSSLVDRPCTSTNAFPVVAK